MNNNATLFIRKLQKALTYKNQRISELEKKLDRLTESEYLKDVIFWSGGTVHFDNGVIHFYDNSGVYIESRPNSTNPSQSTKGER
jgi:hypothetical protein